MHVYTRLEVWTKAHELTLRVYSTTKSFPESERYGLTSQLRRATVSVAANIVEGSGRSSHLDFARFIDVACGSANEVEYHLLLARDLDYLAPENHAELTDRVQRVRQMLTRLRQSLIKPKAASAANPTGKK